MRRDYSERSAAGGVQAREALAHGGGDQLEHAFGLDHRRGNVGDGGRAGLQLQERAPQERVLRLEPRRLPVDRFPDRLLQRVDRPHRVQREEGHGAQRIGAG